MPSPRLLAAAAAAAALAALTSASAPASVNFNLALAAPAPTAAAPPAPALAPRQTINQDCSAAAFSVLDSLPTPPPEVVSELIVNSQTNFCSFTTPAALSAQFASYSSQLVAWASDHQDALTACPNLAQYDTDSFCSGQALPAAATQTASGSAARASASTTNGVARETAAAFAAVAAAGIAVLAL